MSKNDNLGCAKKFKLFNGKYLERENNFDFICGVPNAWGKERLCGKCDLKLRKKWAEQDQEMYKKDKRLSHLIKGGNN